MAYLISGITLYMHAALKELCIQVYVVQDTFISNTKNLHGNQTAVRNIKVQVFSFRTR